VFLYEGHLAVFALGIPSRKLWPGVQTLETAVDCADAEDVGPEGGVEGAELADAFLLATRRSLP